MNVSVLIPTYNRRAQVMSAIESVLAQTRPVQQIIVVDDGSTDGTANELRAQYGSLVTLITQDNAGVSAARNRGIRETQGEWVAFLDSDDIWLPTKIERQLELTESLGSEFGFCFTDCAYAGDPNKCRSVFQEVGFENATEFGPLLDPVACILAGKEPFWMSSLLVRRSLFDNGAPFNEALTLGEDTDLFFRLCFRTRFCFVAEPLVRIDRTPTRDGLCNLFSKRDDRVYECRERLYTGWLAMPEVLNGRCETGVREMLREISYSSAELKLHQLRIRQALKEVRRLKMIGESYPAICQTLFTRKARKLWQHLIKSAHIEDKPSRLRN